MSRDASLSHALATVPKWLLGSVRGLPGLVWVLGAIVLLNSAGRMVSIFLAVYLSTVLKLPEPQIGLIVGAYGAGVVAGSLAAGVLASRVSPVSLMAASLMLMGMGFVILSQVADVAVFTVGVFICASLEGAFRPPAMLLLLGSCPPQERPRSHAVYYSALGLGYAMGAALGGALAQIDFILLFWANGCVSVAAAGAVLCCVRVPESSTDSVPTTMPLEPRQTGAAASSTAAFVALCGVAFLHYSVSNQRLATYPLYLTGHYGLDTADLGLVFSINGLLIATTGITIAALVKHVDQRKVASFGTLLLCGSFALLPLGSQIEVALALCVAMSLGDVLFSPAVTALAYTVTPRREKGRKLGAFFAVVSATRITGPAAGMWAFTFLGPPTTWALCGLFGTLGASILVCLVGGGRANGGAVEA